jgi:hypothetical protein
MLIRLNKVPFFSVFGLFQYLYSNNFKIISYNNQYDIIYFPYLDYFLYICDIIYYILIHFGYFPSYHFVKN